MAHGSNNFIKREVFQIVGTYVTSSAQTNGVKAGYEFHVDISDESIRILASHGPLSDLNLP